MPTRHALLVGLIISISSISFAELPVSLQAATFAKPHLDFQGQEPFELGANVEVQVLAVAPVRLSAMYQQSRSFSDKRDPLNGLKLSEYSVSAEYLFSPSNLMEQFSVGFELGYTEQLDYSIRSGFTSSVLVTYNYPVTTSTNALAKVSHDLFSGNGVVGETRLEAGWRIRINQKAYIGFELSSDTQFNTPILSLNLMTQF